MRGKSSKQGFTIMEMMTTVAIIAILAAIAIPAVLHYRAKASAADIVATHEELQEELYIEAAGIATNDCEEIADHISKKYFTDHVADLSLGFISMKGGYRPVLNVHADKQHNGGYGVKAGKIAHDNFTMEKIIEPGAILEKDTVTYSADLIKGDTPVCTNYQLIATTPPLSPLASQVAPPTPPPAPTPAPTPPPAPSTPPFDPSKSPGNDNNPCKDGQVLSPKDGVTFDGTLATGKCVEATSKDPDYDPYGDRECQVCTGPPQICERLYHKTTCTWPNNVCINELKNSETGARTVVRRCGNAEESYREWYSGTSDNDRCTTFDPQYVQTLAFECTFACITDNCNELVNPLGKTFPGGSYEHKYNMFNAK